VYPGAVGGEHTGDLTVDQLARLTGTTTRNVRALQTRGVLERPRMVGRTGYYGDDHRRDLVTVLRLQRDGFSLDAVARLLDARRSGQTLDQVLGFAADGADGGHSDGGDGADVLDSWPRPRHGRLLSVVPTTVFTDRASA
jgi:DNA-binding transcriptional MerR regulator